MENPEACGFIFSSSIAMLLAYNIYKFNMYNMLIDTIYIIKCLAQKV